MAGKPHYIVAIDYLNQAILFNARCEQIAEFLLDSDDARELIAQAQPIQAVDRLWDCSLDWVSPRDRARAAHYLLPENVRIHSH